MSLRRPEPFARAKFMAAALAAAIGAAASFGPLQRQSALAEAMARVGQYRSRGKGRGTPSRNYGNRSDNAPAHQGEREMLRRRLGGFGHHRKMLTLGLREGPAL
jgi:hypothetical protein